MGLLYETKEDYSSFYVVKVERSSAEWIDIVAAPQMGVTRRLALNDGAARELAIALLALLEDRKA